MWVKSASGLKFRGETTEVAGRNWLIPWAFHRLRGRFAGFARSCDGAVYTLTHVPLHDDNYDH